MGDLFDNAIDSLDVGIRTYLYGDYPTAPKHAIRHVFHAMELLLKERLFREHPLLIYKELNKRISEDSPTVGLEETLARFNNLKIELSAADVETLRDLQRRRNRIEHHKFIADERHRYVLGKALRFIFYFMQDHLGTSLEKEIDEEIYPSIREAILSYEEMLADAKKEAAKLVPGGGPKDPGATPVLVLCPECDNETLVIGCEKGNYCFFCACEVDVEPCPRCGQYVFARELVDGIVCSDCERYILSD
jgi:hypothetical protein